MEMLRKYIRQVLNESIEVDTEQRDDDFVKYETPDGKAYADVWRYKDHWHIEIIESGIKGGGTFIVNKIKEDAKKAGVEKITLGTTEGGYGFWDKMGFKECGNLNDPYDIPMEFLLESYNDSSTLKNKLLSFGGDVAIVGRENEELPKILSRGKLWDYKVEKISGEPNKCYANCAYYYKRFSQDGFRIVSGFALSEGMWIRHVFLIDINRKTILETTFIKWEKYFGYELNTEESELFSNQFFRD